MQQNTKKLQNYKFQKCSIMKKYLKVLPKGTRHTLTDLDKEIHLSTDRILVDRGKNNEKNK